MGTPVAILISKLDEGIGRHTIGACGQRGCNCKSHKGKESYERELHVGGLLMSGERLNLQKE